jgi:phytoene/squalene synthetase
MSSFTSHAKEQIEDEITEDFRIALMGIKMLPPSSKAGVYMAYVYYNSLFNKIRRLSAERVLSERIRINNGKKIGLMINSLFEYKMNLV